MLDKLQPGVEQLCRISTHRDPDAIYNEMATLGKKLLQELDAEGVTLKVSLRNDGRRIYISWEK